MQIGIDGQRDGPALTPGIAVEHPDDRAFGIDLCFDQAGFADQRMVIGLFDARAADPRAGQSEYRAACDLHLIGAHHIADGMRGIRAERIDPVKAAFDDHAGQVDGVNLQPGHRGQSRSCLSTIGS